MYHRQLTLKPAAGDQIYTFPFFTREKGPHVVTARTWANVVADYEQTTFTVGPGSDSADSSSTTTTTQTVAKLPAINGHWAGTFTYAAVKGDTLSPKTLNMVGVVQPMTLDVDLDAQGQGTATMFVDGSALGINGAYVRAPPSWPAISSPSPGSPPAPS